MKLLLIFAVHTNKIFIFHHLFAGFNYKVPGGDALWFKIAQLNYLRRRASKVNDR